MRPPIKEDGTGTPAHEVITYDPDDDGLVYLLNKGCTKTFTFDKVFPASSSQTEENTYLLRKYHKEMNTAVQFLSKSCILVITKLRQ